MVAVSTYPQVCQLLTYKLAPCLSHMLGDAALDSLDLAGTEAGGYKLVSTPVSTFVANIEAIPVLLCLGLVKPGPTGPCRVSIGACVLIFRSRGALSTAAAAMAG
jgi:hypothetical protein